jgi:hypothetical protein
MFDEILRRIRELLLGRATPQAPQAPASSGAGLSEELTAVLFGRQSHSGNFQPRRADQSAASDAVSQSTRPRTRPLKSTRLADLPIGDATHLDFGTGKGHAMGIVGESQRQAALRRLSAGRRERNENVAFVVELVPEPDNPYDPNAVQVMIHHGDQVGYLPREDAKDYRVVFDTLAKTKNKAICRARLIGGTADKPNFGVMIDLASPDELLARLTPGGQPF